ncbi:MAG: hypothetical protein PHS44_01280 [Candidatus Dojkabacteria bacterium]|nr:hypothetical protein [Candidatus Dojkabacteria bacterium]
MEELRPRTFVESQRQTIEDKGELQKVWGVCSTLSKVLTSCFGSGVRLISISFITDIFDFAAEDSRVLRLRIVESDTRGEYLLGILVNGNFEGIGEFVLERGEVYVLLFELTMLVDGSFRELRL